MTTVEKSSGIEGFLSPASFWFPEALVESAWHSHAPFAFWLMETLKPRQFVELGSHHGFSYLAFCQAAQRCGLATKGFAVDTWRGDDHAGFYGDEVYETLRDYHDPRYGSFSRLVRSTFDEALPHFEDGSVDLLHIDGRHFYEDVKHDFESWRGKLSDRAVVLFHDTNVRERDFGVVKLWQELKQHSPAFEFLHGHGLGVLGTGTHLPAALTRLFEASNDPELSVGIRDAYARLGTAIEERFRLSEQEAALRRSQEDVNGLRAQVQQANNRIAEQAVRIEEAIQQIAAHQAAVTAAREAQEKVDGELDAERSLSHQRLNELERLKASHDISDEAQERMEKQLADVRMRFGDLQKRSISSRWLLRAMAGKVLHSPRDISHRIRKSVSRRSKGGLRIIRNQKHRFSVTHLRNPRYRKYLTSRLALTAERVLPRSFADRMRKRMEKHSFSLNRNTAYQDWIAEHDKLSDDDRTLIRKHIGSFGIRPKFSILMPVYDTPERYLLEAIESVRNQLYTDWELCIVDDASTATHIRQIIERYSRADARIKPFFRPANGGIAAATNDALEIASGDWVVLTDHDDVLAEHSLYMAAEALNQEPNAAIIYSDEDQIDEQGCRSNPYFKPDFSYDFFLSHNLISHQGAYRADLARQVDGFRENFEGSQDWDFALRILDATTIDRIHHIPAILYHWRQTAGSFSNSWLGRARDAACKAVNDHLVRTEQSAVAVPQGTSSYVRVRRHLPEIRPLVSIVIPTKDHCNLLSKCVDGLLERTDYAPLEIVIVNNGSSQRDALDLLDGLRLKSNVKVLDDPRPFNYSQLVNLGVANARGEICVLLNNDVDVINSDWLDELVGHAIRPGVGAVGAKLYYANDTIQHGGVILGIGGIAGHAHRFAPRDAPGYFNRLKLTHNLSCVTAACLATRKSVYEQVGGFDEQNLTVAFNDVDFCLRVRQAGYSIVWTPYAEMYHYESISRGSDATPQNAPRAKAEIDYMRRRWATVLHQDPFHNPNLTLDSDSNCFEFAKRPRVRKPWQSYTPDSRFRMRAIAEKT